MRTLLSLTLTGLFLLSGGTSHAENQIGLHAIPQQTDGKAVPGIAPEARCFAIEAMIDPAEIGGGDLQALASLALGLPGKEGEGSITASANPGK